jgi:hypothetical protein
MELVLWSNIVSHTMYAKTLKAQNPFQPYQYTIKIHTCSKFTFKTLESISVLDQKEINKTSNSVNLKVISRSTSTFTTYIWHKHTIVFTTPSNKWIIELNLLGLYVQSFKIVNNQHHCFLSLTIILYKIH